MNIFTMQYPTVWLYDPATLHDIKWKIRANDSDVQAPLEILRHYADKALSECVPNIIDKVHCAPSNDPHDYLSRGPYWWPNPDTPSGLPYIQKDGEVNPEVKNYDQPKLKKLLENVRILALAYFYTDHLPYGEQAACLLRSWFVDERTRMNPHLEYGQGIPGRCAGRSIGIIETSGLVSVLDAVGLIATVPQWTEKEQEMIKCWFSDYLTWLTESDHGKMEAIHKNNHGTNYDLQVVSFAFFTGRLDVAEQKYENTVSQRLRAQIEPDGRQPHELARTKGLSYSVMNLVTQFKLAYLGKHFGRKYLNVDAAEKHLLNLALDFICPYLADQEKWPYQQIISISVSNKGTFDITWVLRKASELWGDPRYEDLLQELLGDERQTTLLNLIAPSRYGH